MKEAADSNKIQYDGIFDWTDVNLLKKTVTLQDNKPPSSSPLAPPDPDKMKVSNKMGFNNKLINLVSQVLIFLYPLIPVTIFWVQSLKIIEAYQDKVMIINILKEVFCRELITQWYQNIRHQWQWVILKIAS